MIVDRCGVEASVRRYRIDIPSGLQGEHLYLVSAKKGRSWPDSPYDGGEYLLATIGQVRWPFVGLMSTYAVGPIRHRFAQVCVRIRDSSKSLIERLVDNNYASSLHDILAASANCL